MLTAKPQLNLRNAREYFREHLSVGDYYSAGQKITGEWFGQGAEKLGLQGAVNEAEFLRLCEGQHPQTGQHLTKRKNSVRRSEDGRQVANRRVFYDFTLSPPKSVSVFGLCVDERISGAHSRAVRTAMTELERFAEARVRRLGQRAERRTSNVVGAAFVHETSRALDPHLHTHCVLFNATFDAAEKGWKALEVQAMYRAQRFVENTYFHELARELRRFGYEIENEGRAFRIKGVPEAVTARFSKRHQQIDEETQNQISRGRQRGNVKDLREQIARDGRQRKMQDSTAARLRPSWLAQLSADEKKALERLRRPPATSRSVADVGRIVAWSEEYLFERRSVVREPELLAAALGRGRGEDFDLAALRAAVSAHGFLRETETDRLTSRSVLQCELELVVAAHDGRNRHPALAAGYQPTAALSAEQRVAVERLLGSRDLITLFRGGAGTGKSFALKEVERGLRVVQRPVVVLAPQRQQVHDLQADGLPAQTLAHCLQVRALPPGAVVVLDEAGQVGGRTLRELVGLVRAVDGRLILSGDTRQHGAVAASDALRAIEQHAGLRPAVLRQIRRQDPKLGASAQERGFIRGYRAAVKAAARGAVAESFDRLEKLGCIREVAPTLRRDTLAGEFVAAVERNEKVIVVAQTRDEARSVNDAIRMKLEATNRLGQSVALTTCHPLDLGEAEKRDSRFYRAGQRAFFLRRYGRFAKGELCEIAGASEHGVVLIKDGRRSTLSYRYADRLVVAEPQETAIAPGDRLQLKFNGKSQEGTTLNNGELVTVHRVRNDGAVVVHGDDGRHKTLTPSQRLWVRGYAVTSYASQGKTVDTVLFADASSRAATSARQWYVTISRGRKRVVVFTPDREALRTSVERTGDRELALELKLKPAALRTLLSEGWQQRALAAIERHRRHRSVLQSNQNRNRIAL